MNFSVTQISCYKECPQKYKLRYIDRIETPKSEALEFGSLFHESIPKFGIQTFGKDLQEMLEVLYSKYKKDGKQFELKLYQNVDGLNFTTIVDAVDDNEIDEFKTAKDFWTEEKFKEELQSAVYLRSEFERTGKWKKFNYWIITKPNGRKKPKLQTKEIPYDEKKWELVKGICSKIIQDFEFEPTAYKNNKCGWCEYKDHCPAYF